jgi:DNA-binding NarL/FixJ family response regulator
VKKGLPPVPSDVARQHVVLLCGDMLLHRNIFSDSVSRAAGLASVRCAENREEISAVCRLLKVSVIIARRAFIDQLPGSDIVQLTNYGKGSHLLAVLETDVIETASAAKMLRLGCRGVLPNRFSSKLLRRAVLAVLKKQLWAPGAVVSDLLSDLLRTTSLKTESGLTPQEARILELTSQGYKNAAIAEALFISLETVRWHKRRLNRKLREPGRLPQSKAATLPPREMAAG